MRYTQFKDTVKKYCWYTWTQVDIQGYEPTDSILRMPIGTGSWNFKKTDSINCKASDNFRFYRCGNPPTCMINILVKSSISIEINHLREFIKRIKRIADNMVYINSGFDALTKMNL